MKVFSNMKRITKGFSGQAVELFPNMLNAVESSLSRSTSSLSPTPTPSPTPTSSPTPESTHAPPSPQPPTPQPSPPQPSPTHLGSEYHPPTPHDSPLHAVHSHGSDEGSLKLQELMTLVNLLSDRVGILEADLTKTKQTYSSAYTKLILRVKKLEAQIKVGKARRHSRRKTLLVKKLPPVKVAAEVHISTLEKNGFTYSMKNEDKRMIRIQGNFKILTSKDVLQEVKPVFGEDLGILIKFSPLDARMQIIPGGIQFSAPEGFDLMHWEITHPCLSLMRMMKFERTNMNTIFELEITYFCGVHRFMIQWTWRSIFDRKRSILESRDLSRFEYTIGV
ncbi:hypothetical protein Tco_0026994 [Tanacetum coccineum]